MRLKIRAFLLLVLISTILNLNLSNVHANGIEWMRFQEFLSLDTAYFTGTLSKNTCSNGPYFGLFSEQSKAHPVGPSFIALHRQSAGKFEGFACSNTLIGPNLVLAAGHCKVAPEKNVGYEFEEGLPEGAYFAVKQVLKRGAYTADNYEGRQDYAIYELNEPIGFIYGWKGLAATPAKIGEILTIIQHPYAGPKQVSFGPVVSTIGGYLQYRISTANASSGAGVFNGLGELVAVHTNGGCIYPTFDRNTGYSVDAIMKDFPELSQLVLPAFRFDNGSSIVLFNSLGYFASDLTLKDSKSEWSLQDFEDGSFGISTTGESTTKAWLGVTLNEDKTASLTLYQDLSMTDPLAYRWRILSTKDQTLRIMNSFLRNPVWLSGSTENKVTLVQDGTHSEWRIESY